jgi:energy-converting hydrogenase Eha subunit A
MEGKARFIFPVLMAGVMAFLMSALITALNLGLPPDFVVRWMKAFVIAWPAATIAAFIAIPIARKVTGRLVALIEGRA